MKKQKNKGTLVWDDCVGDHLQDVPKKAGYKILRPKKTERGIGMSDQQLIERYASRFPLVTHDRTIYDDEFVARKSAGILELEDVKPNELKAYKLVFEKFFENTKYKEMKKKVHIIKKSGKVIKKKLK